MDDIPEDKRFSFTWQQLMPTAPLPLPPPLVEPVTQLPATDFVSPIISDALDVPARNLKERQRKYTHEARQGSVEEEVVVSWPPMQHNMHGMQLDIQHAMPCAMRSQLTALLIGPVRPPGSLAGLAVTRQRFACWGPALMHQLRSAQGGHIAVQATRELFRAVRAEMRRTFDMMDQSDKRLHIKEIMECCSAVGVNPRRHHSMAVQLALGAEVDDRMGTRGHFWFRDVQFELELYLALPDHLLVSNSLVFMAASYLLQRLIVCHMASGYSMEFDPQLVTNLIREIDALGLPFPAKTKIHYPQLANWVEEYQYCSRHDCSYPTFYGPALHLSFGTLNGVPHVVPATEAEVSSVTSKSWHSRDGPMTPAGAVASLSSASPPASPPPEEVVLPPAAPTPTEGSDISGLVNFDERVCWSMAATAELDEPAQGIPTAQGVRRRIRISCAFYLEELVRLECRRIYQHMDPEQQEAHTLEILQCCAAAGVHLEAFPLDDHLHLQTPPNTEYSSSSCTCRHSTSAAAHLCSWLCP